MPFIIIEKKESGSYIRIVESYRDEQGKSKHRTLYNLGKTEMYSVESLKNIGKSLYKAAGGDVERLESDSLQALAHYNYGFVLIYKKILQYYGLDKFLQRISQKGHIQINVYQCVLLMLIERLNDPVSKFGNYINQNDYLGIEPLELHHLYRSLDYLCDNQNQIKDIIYQKGRDLFNQKLDVVFYDVTTFYFDSEKVQENNLRQKGFGKDGKIGKTQVVFGMLIDKNKHPVTYELYSGDTYEVHTFCDSLKTLKQRYQIDKVIVVADTGMMNTDNLKYISKETDYEYILGERLKNLSEKAKRELTNHENYQKTIIIDDTEEQEPVIIKYFEYDYKDKKLICTYSQKRAKKDMHEREERIKKALKMLEKPSEINKKASRYFIKQTNEKKYELDIEKIQNSAQYDGFLCIATNNKELKVEEILDHYKHLFQIEHCFRSFKSYIETRPMFHWTNSRIEGHICLCYIAYTLLINLQIQLKNKGLKCSENNLRKIMVKMQMGLIRQNKYEYYLRNAMNEETKQVLKVLKIPEPPDLIPKAHINNYL